MFDVIQPDAIYDAMYAVFTFNTLFWLAIGVTIGVGVGAIPGLSASTGIAIMLPLTFAMDMQSSLGLIIGLYKGAVYGGSISAITFATPGTPAAAATVYDGYKLMKKGKGKKAILMALYASISADFLSDVLTIMIAPVLAVVALQFGPSERFWLVVLAFALLGSLSGMHPAKGLLSAAFGLFIGTIGSDPIGAVARMTFDLWWLQERLPLIPVMIGVFAMSRMLEEVINHIRTSKMVQDSTKDAFASLFGSSGEGLSLREYLSCWKEMMIGLGLGSFVGMLPGLGSTVGAFLSYSVAKQASPHKKIGTGVLEGVAAAEAGNNATVGPTLIPLLAFGIPGSSAAALIGGALVMKGATPSPQMFELYPVVVYSLFIILLIGNIFNLAIGRVFALLYARLGQLPQPILTPLIILLALLGTYSYRQNPYDVIIMLVFGFIGYGMRLVGIPDAPMVITFLISPMMEASLRRALLIHQGSWLNALFNSPISIGLFVFGAILTYMSIRFNVAERMREMDEEQEGIDETLAMGK